MDPIFGNDTGVVRPLATHEQVVLTARVSSAPQAGILGVFGAI